MAPNPLFRLGGGAASARLTAHYTAKRGRGHMDVFDTDELPTTAFIMAGGEPIAPSSSPPQRAVADEASRVCVCAPQSVGRDADTNGFLSERLLKWQLVRPRSLPVFVVLVVLRESKPDGSETEGPCQKLIRGATLACA